MGFRFFCINKQSFIKRSLNKAGWGRGGGGLNIKTDDSLRNPANHAKTVEKNQVKVNHDDDGNDDDNDAANDSS